jgi:hypothetical protein
VVTTACPATHRTLSARREVPLAHETRPRGAARPAIELTVDCEPIERLAALVVRVRGPAPLGLPVRVRDHVVGQIDARGIAHIVLRVAPHTTLRVQLDTTTAPELEPKSPVQSFALGADDSIVLFDQALTRARAPRRRQRHEAARGRAALLPYRVD